MPYKNKASQREYQRLRNARIRRAWLAENGPCRHCGSTQDLEVDHVDPGTKVDHKVWSWAAGRRNAELAKCQVLCRRCHHAKSRGERPSTPCGTQNQYRYRKCRCALCKRAHADYVAKYR